jgi:hypothetical protein
MPRSPDDSEGRQPARKSKRTRRTTTPLRTDSTTSRAKVAAFPATDTSLANGYSPEIQQAAAMLLSQDPLVILGVILKVVLGDRIKDEEILYICNTHYRILMNKSDQ